MTDDGGCMSFLSVCEVNHTGHNREKREDAWLLPAFLQISSGRYPEGGLCKKSLWISETHMQDTFRHNYS